MNTQKTLYGLIVPTELPRGRSAKQCEQCEQWFTLPACHAMRHRCCSDTCSIARRLSAIAARQRQCDGCAAGFIPRPWQLRNGIGRYCSVVCSQKVANKACSQPEVRAKALSTLFKNIALGVVAFKSGEKNRQWTGGSSASSMRRQESGAALEYMRAYRKANPEKVREWAKSKKRRKYGKLPRGTVARLLVLQKNCCAYCRKTLSAGYHVDHVMPLKLGGKHESSNVQLLCPTCNVRKSAKHPIVYANERGMLL